MRSNLFGKPAKRSKASEHHKRQAAIEVIRNGWQPQAEGEFLDESSLPDIKTHQLQSIAAIIRGTSNTALTNAVLSSLLDLEWHQYLPSNHEKIDNALALPIFTLIALAQTHENPDINNDYATPLMFLLDKVLDSHPDQTAMERIVSHTSNVLTALYKHGFSLQRARGLLERIDIDRLSQLNHCLANLPADSKDRAHLISTLVQLDDYHSQVRLIANLNQLLHISPQAASHLLQLHKCIEETASQNSLITTAANILRHDDAHHLNQHLFLTKLNVIREAPSLTEMGIDKDDYKAVSDDIISFESQLTAFLGIFELIEDANLSPEGRQKTIRYALRELSSKEPVDISVTHSALDSALSMHEIPQPLPVNRAAEGDEGFSEDEEDITQAHNRQLIMLTIKTGRPQDGQEEAINNHLRMRP